MKIIITLFLNKILDALDKVETKLDELSYGKTEIKVEEKEYKTFRDKYNARTFKEYMSYLGGLE